MIDNSYVLVSVPASPNAPHAVVKDNDLRYPVRDGASKRWMREPEVAARYRSRFTSAERQLDRLESIDASVRRLLDPDGEETWLVVSALPDSRGRVTTGFDGRTQMEAWIRYIGGSLPASGAFGRTFANLDVGFRRYVASDIGGDRRYASRVCGGTAHGRRIRISTCCRVGLEPRTP